MATETKRDYTELGKQSYQRWRDELRAESGYEAVYDEEAAKSHLWLQLVEARQAAGLSQRDLAKQLGVSQAQVARLEKRGYDAYTLSSLRRYVQALGKGFSLEVSVHTPERAGTAEPAPTSP
jgi:ribosome-binding protein aMBF1 (putative translation factor)